MGSVYLSVFACLCVSVCDFGNVTFHSGSSVDLGILKIGSRRCLSPLSPSFPSPCSVTFAPPKIHSRTVAFLCPLKKRPGRSSSLVWNNAVMKVHGIVFRFIYLLRDVQLLLSLDAVVIWLCGKNKSLVAVWLFLSSSFLLAHTFRHKPCQRSHYFKKMLSERQRCTEWQIEVFLYLLFFSSVQTQ